MLIRQEQKGDWGAVYRINASAFDTTQEAELVNSLRNQASPIVSLLAEIDGQIVGHILFSPVSLSGYSNLAMMGLAPMAVAPDQQRKGIGSALVHAGLEQCCNLKTAAVVVLGHPEYYPRFGFLPSSKLNMDSQYDVPEEVFMLLELEPGALKGKTGRIEYHSAFGAL